MRAEEIAARLGVSRAALYRYEKGEVIKLDTIKRLAELLKISPMSLLGIGVEYYSRPVGFFERLRQVEETADQILQLAGPFCYLTTSDAFETAMAEVYEELAEQAGPDRGTIRANAEQLMGILATRRRIYNLRRPNIIAMISISAVQNFLAAGVAGGVPVSERLRRMCRDAATREIEHIATMMETEPMGLQFGLLSGQDPSSSFKIMRSRDKASLAVNPFRADTQPAGQTGVSMITAADEAIAAHQRVAEANWRDAVKGPAGATRLRQLIAATN